MYYRQTESWWLKFVGEAIVGTMTGAVLELVPARIVSFVRSRERFPDGQALVPNDRAMRAYGTNPYRFYDERRRPFLFRSELHEDTPPLSRVVTIDKKAWSLDLVRAKGTIQTDGRPIITWELGDGVIADGKDFGNVVVQRTTDEGLRDVPNSVNFAFAFHAFYPNSAIHICVARAHPRLRPRRRKAAGDAGQLHLDSACPDGF